MTAMVEAVRSPVRALPVVRVTAAGLHIAHDAAGADHILGLDVAADDRLGADLEQLLGAYITLHAAGHKLHIAALHIALDVGKELDVSLGEDVALEDACDLHKIGRAHV